MSALTYEAIQNNISLEAASQRIANLQASIDLSMVLDVLFQSQAHSSNDEETEFIIPDLLRQDLDELIVNPEVINELNKLAHYLWEPITTEWETWLSTIYHGTLGAALLKTIGDLCPSINLDDLSIDLERGPNARPKLAVIPKGFVEVWITEKNPGGSGLIEEFMRDYSEDPRRFFSMVRASLEMGEFELIDYQLGKLLCCLADEQNDTKTKTETPDVVRNIRASQTFAALESNLRVLRKSLLKDGFTPFHGFIVSIGNRVLRPGAGPGTDRYLAQAIRSWNAEEIRLGVEIDLRVICFWLSKIEGIDLIIEEVDIPEGQDRQAWRMNAIYGLLWARGRMIRTAALQTRNQFIELPPIERLLVIDSIVDERHRVPLDNSQWFDTVQAFLSQGSLVTLTSPVESRHKLGEAIHALITNPVDTGYLRAYARLQGVRQTKDMYEADFELLEAPQ